MALLEMLKARLDRSCWACFGHYFLPQRGNGLNDPPAAPGHLGVSAIRSELLWHEHFQAGEESRFENLALFQPRNFGFGF